MEIQKITYDTKKYIRNDPNYPKTQTITDEDMNEIKSVVNNNAYKQDEDYLKLKNAALNAETEESKSLYVTDANKFGSLEVLGNHGQETRKGYNLLQNKLTDTTINGVTFKINEDKSVTVNGTATANIIANLITGEYNDNNATEPLIIPDNITNCRLSGCPSGGSSSTYKLDIYNQEYALLATDWGEGTNVTIDSQEDKKIARVRIIIYSGATVNNLTFKPMLVAGTEEREYEQYGASPSPEFESPVICLGSNKNELDLKAQSQYGITVTKNADDTLNITGTATASGNLSLLNKNIVLKANKSYTFSVKKFSGQDISNSIWFWNATDSNSEITLSLTSNVKTFTFTKDTTLSALNISVNTGDVFDITLALKAEEGTEATSYSPYNQGSTEISKINKNLFNKNNVNILQGYIDGSGNIQYDTSNKIFYIKCLKNIDVTVSGIYLRGIACYNKIPTYNLKTSVKNINQATYLTLNTGDNTYLAVWYYGNTTEYTEQQILDSIQVEKGDVETNHVEHEQTDYLLYIQQEMLKGDYFAKEADGWKEVHNYPKINSDNFNNITENTAYSGLFMLTVEDLYRNDIKTSVFSDYYKAVTPGYMNSNLQTTEYNISAFTNNRIFITHNDFANNLSGLKNFLIDNNVSIFAKTTTPTKLACTEEQSVVLEELSNLDLFEGVNNIITAEDIALLKLKYSLDVETYVDNKIEEKLANINQQILEIVGGN